MTTGTKDSGASPGVQTTAGKVHPTAPRTPSEINLPPVPSDPKPFLRLGNFPLLARTRSDAAPMVGRGWNFGGRRLPNLPVRFHSDPGPRPTKATPSTPENPKDDCDSLDEECAPGSGHCGTAQKDEDLDEAGRVGTDIAAFGSTIDAADEDTSSMEDFVCRTAGALERSWAAVMRAKEQRPDWLKSWSF